jgi:hypothetical protein
VARGQGLKVVQAGSPPPCLRPGGMICRGCPGWEAMLREAGEGGAWAGALISCSCTGLALRGGTSLERGR